MSDNPQPLNLPSVAHNFMKAVDKDLDYQVNFVHFRYWGTCLVYGIPGFYTFRLYTNICKCVWDKNKVCTRL